MGDVLAYFITFTCKGSRLHGDERESVDRDHAEYGSEYCAANPVRQASAAQRLGEIAVVLSQSQREVVEKTIRAVTEYRGWTIHGLVVRSNHVHVVITASGVRPEAVMQNFKAYSTRRLREAGLLGPKEHPWTRHGSTRYLWKEIEVARAVDYVREQQDDPERFREG